MRLLSRLMAAITLSLTLAGSLSWQAHAAEKLTVYLDWFVNPDHAPLVIAKTQGYFAEAGLDVDFAFFQAAQPMAVAIASGDADFAVTAISGGLVWLARKDAVRVIAGALR